MKLIRVLRAIRGSFLWLRACALMLAWDVWAFIFWPIPDEDRPAWARGPR